MYEPIGRDATYQSYWSFVDAAMIIYDPMFFDRQAKPCQKANKGGLAGHNAFYGVKDVKARLTVSSIVRAHKAA